MTVVVSEKMAQRFWPGQDPIGKRLKGGSTTSDAPWREVIGVVKDVRQNDFVAEPKMQMYMSYRQLKNLAPNALVIRTTVDPMSLATAVRMPSGRSTKISRFRTSNRWRTSWPPRSRGSASARCCSASSRRSRWCSRQSAFTAS
jgi:hypothetical protein